MPIVKLPSSWGSETDTCNTGKGITISGIEGEELEGYYEVCVVHGAAGRAECGYVRHASNRRHALRLIKSIACIEKMIEEGADTLGILNAVGTKIRIVKFLGGHLYQVDVPIHGTGHIVQVHRDGAAIFIGHALNGLLYVYGSLSGTPHVYFVPASAHFDPPYVAHRLKIAPFPSHNLYV